MLRPWYDAQGDARMGNFPDFPQVEVALLHDEAPQGVAVAV